MRLALISDIHANLEALTAVMAAIRRDGADRIVCLGDIVGYNADPDACVELLRTHDVIAIAGNHDRAVTGHLPLAGFKRRAARAIRWTRRRLDPASLDWLSALPVSGVVGDRLTIVHGALHPGTDEGRLTVRLDTDDRRALTLDLLRRQRCPGICAVGHTHRHGVHTLVGGAVRQVDPADGAIDPRFPWLINPGTVGEPRDGDARAGYMLLDLDGLRFQHRRVAYDHEAARRKADRAGLILRPVPLPASWKRGLRRLEAALWSDLSRIG